VGALTRGRSVSRRRRRARRKSCKSAGPRRERRRRLRAAWIRHALYRRAKELRCCSRVAPCTSRALRYLYPSRGARRADLGEIKLELALASCLWPTRLTFPLDSYRTTARLYGILNHSSTSYSLQSRLGTSRPAGARSRSVCARFVAIQDFRKRFEGWWELDWEEL